MNTEPGNVRNRECSGCGEVFIDTGKGKIRSTRPLLPHKSPLTGKPLSGTCPTCDTERTTT